MQRIEVSSDFKLRAARANSTKYAIPIGQYAYSGGGESLLTDGKMEPGV
jgi:urease accessory protein UreF